MGVEKYLLAGILGISTLFGTYCNTRMVRADDPPKQEKPEKNLELHIF